jgi:Mn2+/Fe2+ NRAMP family transporter
MDEMAAEAQSCASCAKGVLCSTKTTRDYREADRPRAASKFYAVLAVAVLLGLALSLLGLDAVRMLFWAAVVNGVLAPPLVVLVVLLTNDPKVMGERVNSPTLRVLGWATAFVMAAASIVMLFMWLW